MFYLSCKPFRAELNNRGFENVIFLGRTRGFEKIVNPKNRITEHQLFGDQLSQPVHVTRYSIVPVTKSTQIMHILELAILRKVERQTRNRASAAAPLSPQWLARTI